MNEFFSDEKETWQKRMGLIISIILTDNKSCQNPFIPSAISSFLWMNGASQNVSEK
jgi:hypothetical protein